MAIALERTYRFAAGHVYHRPEWSDAENERRFGACSRLPGHGHNYRLTVRIGGEIDPLTGFVIDLGQLDGLVRERVLDRLDHRQINAALPEFGSGPDARIPTGEELVRWVADQLSGRLPAGARLIGLRLAEDDDLAATWEAAES